MLILVDTWVLISIVDWGQRDLLESNVVIRYATTFGSISLIEMSIVCLEEKHILTDDAVILRIWESIGIDGFC